MFFRDGGVDAATSQGSTDLSVNPKRMLKKAVTIRWWRCLKHLKVVFAETEVADSLDENDNLVEARDREFEEITWRWRRVPR